jgi:hypothetical protein
VLSAINGFEGRVELRGARAVAGLFQRWSLRREGSGDWPWSFHADLSYQKTNLLKHPKFKRKVLIKVIGKDPHEGVWYEIRLQDGQEPVINGDELTIKGAQLCRVDPTGRS